MRRILFLTDSLSLPQERDGEKVRYEDTYIEKFRSHFSEIFEVITFQKGGGTSEDLVSQSNYYAGLDVDFLVLQIGIVDCAPRAFTQFEYSVLNRLRLRRFVRPFKEIIRRHRKKTFTDKSTFESNLTLLLAKIKSKEVICLSILGSNPKYESILPGITKNIREYNMILQKFGSFIDINEAHTYGGVTSDHHHLNRTGHQYYFECLKNHFKDLV